MFDFRTVILPSSTVLLVVDRQISTSARVAGLCASEPRLKGEHISTFLTERGSSNEEELPPEALGQKGQGLRLHTKHALGPSRKHTGSSKH